MSGRSSSTAWMRSYCSTAWLLSTWGPSWTFRSAAFKTCSRRSEEHTSELQSLMRISYAVFCLKKKNITNTDLITDVYKHVNDKLQQLSHIHAHKATHTTFHNICHTSNIPQ